ncbi:Nucleotide-binding protein [Frankliniella fusca]|uniref:Nucleotide-binding protein n=1 Tax=Frankliniella fusca TaxID=407009 RepID=A0AAE1HK71_9NEOP|nr:Nucleotide-binding protein [Frankliniella fusca]
MMHGFGREAFAFLLYPVPGNWKQLAEWQGVETEKHAFETCSASILLFLSSRLTRNVYFVFQLVSEATSTTPSISVKESLIYLSMQN